MASESHHLFEVDVQFGKSHLVVDGCMQGTRAGSWGKYTTLFTEHVTCWALRMYHLRLYHRCNGDNNCIYFKGLL